jgi:hypothetical protein
MTMAEEGFFKRWSRRKVEAEQGHEPAPEPVPQSVPEPAAAPDAAPAPAFVRAGVQAYAPADAHAPAPAPASARQDAHAADPAPPPTMADVALLTPESDFSAFVRQGVDADVRRTALKKLFADPHFNTMDRLDVYIDDYNKPSPVSEAMLASLRHAKSVFQHLAKDEEEEAGAAQPEAQTEAQTTQDPPAPDADSQPQTPLHMALQTPGADAYQQHPPETETR